MTSQRQNESKMEKNLSEENNRLLNGILLALLEDKSRESKAKILKDAGFNQQYILKICGPSLTTLRTRKYRENKKKNG